MKAVILSRVSSKEQQEGHSIDAQTMLLKEYCERKNLNIIQTFEIVESSTKGGRKEFKEMLAYIDSQKEPVALVCHKVDRLQRSFNEYHLLNTPLQDGKLELHFTSDNTVITKNSTSQEKMMWSMNIVMAQSYTDSISDNVKRSYKKKLAEGTILGASPIGYINTKDENGKNTVKLDIQRNHFIKRLFEEYSTGLYSLNTLREMATDWGLTSKTGKKLAKNQIGSIIDNPFYYGCMKYHEKLYPHVYQTTVSKDLWNACQDIRKGKKKDYSKETKTDFIFKGLIKCKKCGCTISPEIKKAKYVYLRPNTKKGCDCKQVTEKYALDLVEKALVSISMPEEMLIAFKDTLKANIDNKKEFNEQSIKSLELRSHDIQKQLDKLLDLMLAGSITQDVFDKKNNELRAEQHNINERVKQYLKADEQFAITVQYMMDIASRANELFKSSGNDKKRRIINIVFSNLYLNGETLEFTMKKPFDKLTNLSKGLNWLR
jgi:site-specific DNA recombinase